MRKKSHISVAKLIVDNMEHSELRRHWKAFYLGSILPDCRPSFVTRKHEYDSTFERMAEEIRCLSGKDVSVTAETGAYFRRLGEVLHYVADYFTFPHNAAFMGSIREHCRYEKRLKNYMKRYIESGRAARQERRMKMFASVEALLEFIRSSHREYNRRIHSIEEDARYIVRLCQQVAYGVLCLLERSLNGQGSIMQAAG